MMKLIESQEICKAVYYNEMDFLSKPDISDPYSLIYENIFPYRFIPKDDETETKKTYITLSFGRYTPNNTHYKSGLVYINVFTHKDLFRTNYGSLRTDYLLNEIHKKVNHSDGLGIGKAQLHMMDELYVNNSYQGNYIAYKLYDFV